MTYETLRDAAAEKRSKRQCTTGQPDLDRAISWYLKVGFEDGFDAALKELMPMVEELVEALDIAVSELDQYSRGRRDQSFEGWQSQWTEVPIKHESDYEFYPNHIEKDFVESLRSKLFAWRKFKGVE